MTGEQISATQTNHRRGMGAEEPLAARCKAHSRWGICCKFFGKKIAILMPFGLHFACFQTHSKEQNFWDLKAS